MSNLRATDIGYGRAKSLSEDRQLEFPSVVGPFRPVRFSVGMLHADPAEKLCCEYAGKKFFLGTIALKQSDAMLTLSPERFTQPEGLALLFSSLALLSRSSEETINLIGGLPVSDYSERKDRYRQTLTGRHYIKLFNPDGSGEKGYRFNIADCRILPQPMGTIFDKILNDRGEIVNRKLAAGNIGVIDVGSLTLDLVRTDGLEFIDNQSESYSDLGLYTCYEVLYREIKGVYGIEIPPARAEQYLLNGYIEIDGYKQNIDGIKRRVFESHAEKIVSRTLALWRNSWQLNTIIITGGGAAVLGDYISRQLNRPNQVEVVERGRATFSNVAGYMKFARKVWGNGR